ncbi:tape measure protein [Actinobaculum sp. 352]|uniref:tape measure protein n=1 Tax=Actinobaculum sp. 352 TaxID=2490946 RepID=UPI000F7E7B8A|nr:tape measure protein [Actinobaculum sp. 352]RTE47729.1 hypothetical protein EKN07_12125 [Actinobaculum sp. 352]
MAKGYDLGTAWLNVVPSFNGVKKAIASELGGINIPGMTSHWSTGIIESVGGAFKRVSQIGIAGFVAVGAAATTSLGAAIKRADTLNNFPKIMQNLGYSADDASASIEKMSDKLDGLPTSLDSMAGMVQLLAPLTSSLDEATDLSLAFNNALLAGGKSTEIQANAMEQYTQMLSVGKVDMQAWRSLVSAMPGQLNQLAESLLGAGNNAMDLYDAMADGRVSFDDFNQAILDLNENGLEGFASFEEQARDATMGIGTALDNLKNRTTKALSGILQEFGVEDLADGINRLSEPIATLGQNIQDLVHSLKEGEGLTEWGKDLVTVAGGLGAFGGAGAALENWGSISSFFDKFDKVGKVGGHLKDAGKDISAFTSNIGPNWSKFVKEIKDRVTIFDDAFGGIGKRIGGKLSPAAETIKTHLSGVGSKLSSGFSTVTGGIQSGMSKVFSPLSSFGSSIKSRLTPVFENIHLAFSGLGDHLLGGLKTSFDKIGGLIGQFFSPGRFLKFFALGALIGALVAGIGALASQMSHEMVIKMHETLADLPDMISNIVSAITDQLPELMDVGTDMIAVILQAIIDNLPALVDGATRILTSLVTGLSQALPKLIPMAAQIITTLITALVQALPQIIQAGLELLTGLVQGIINSLPVLIEAIPQIIEAFVTTLVEALPLIMETGVQLLTAIIDGITQTIPMLIDMLPTIIDTVVNTLVENLPAIIDAGVELLVALISGLTEAIPQLVAMLPTIITTIVSTLAGHFPEIVTAGMDALGSLISGITDKIPDLLSKVGELPGKILDALGDLGSLLVEAGKSIISGLWEGMKSAWNGVKNWVGGIGSWIGDHKGPKEYDLKLLVPNGMWIMQGLAHGLEKEFNGRVLGVVDAMGPQLGDALGTVTTGVTLPDIAAVSPAANRFPSTMVLRVGEKEFTGYVDERADGRIVRAARI